MEEIPIDLKNEITMFLFGTIMTDSGTFQSYVYGGVEYENRDTVEFQINIKSDISTGYISSISTGIFNPYQLIQKFSSDFS